ncbi:hypothetical protein GC093_23750, partial [Paenibacillus sp. LMG 31456]
GSWMPIEVNIEGKMLKMPTNPVIESGTTLVPMRAIFEALGAEIKWDNKTQTVTGTKGNIKIELSIGSKTAKKNGTASQLSVAPQLVDGNTMIPLRYVSESLEMHVAWIASERQVYIAKDRTIDGTTMASIEALFDKYAPTFKGDRFVEKPSLITPLAAGKLSNGFLQDGLKTANLVRELAGLPTLVLDSEYNDIAQHGSVLLLATDQYTHTPVQTDGVTNAFFEKAYAGTSTSNIGGTAETSAVTELSDGIKSSVIDNGVSDMGHRRWVLDPNLYKIGLGYSSKVASYDKNITNSSILMRVTDKSQPIKPDYDYIEWPSKGYFPISWLPQRTAWSIALNPDKYKTPEINDVTGKITNVVDGSVVDLVPWQTPGFTILYDNYGEGPTITFLPQVDDAYFKDPKAGNEFVIELNGIYKADGTPANIKYTVSCLQWSKNGGGVNALPFHLYR